MYLDVNVLYYIASYKNNKIKNKLKYRYISEIKIY